jgi:hypothetical protein
MQVAPLVVAGEVLSQPREPVLLGTTVTQPTEFSAELGLGTAASNATQVVDALTVEGLLDLGATSLYYVGVNGSETPVCADDPVVDVVGVDRKLFDAANATKARTHFCWGRPGSCWGRPGSLAGGSNEPPPSPLGGPLGFAEFICCVPPWTMHMLFLSPIFLCAFLYNTLCSKHKDMEFPPWAGAALVMTDKGVIGRRHFGPDDESPGPVTGSDFDKQGLNAITWSGFDVDRNVRIRPYDACMCTSSCDPISNSWDPLVCGLYFGLVLPCWRCICIQPNKPGLYRATIESKHTKGFIPTGSIDLLALARSPEELRSSLRALKERYLDSLPTTTVVHDFGAGRLGIDSFRSDTGRAEVVVVNEGSKAESYGMQVGDTILELDGQSVDYDAFHAGLNAARRAKRTVRLLIARGG